VKQLWQQLVLRLAATAFVQTAVLERADLSAFRHPPSPLVIAGVFSIALSFLLGWPAVAAFGILAVHYREPWLVVVGGPLIYGLSHLIFLLGMYLSGWTYTLIFCRWLARVTVEKLQARGTLPERIPQLPS
jgi:hypothetical protein